MEKREKQGRSWGIAIRVATTVAQTQIADNIQQQLQQEDVFHFQRNQVLQTWSSSTLKRHWAQKKNRNYLKPVAEAIDLIHRKYDAGMGSENKDQRSNAETVVFELRN